MALAYMNNQPFNLAVRMEWPNPLSLDDIKRIVAIENVDLDARNERGWSILMIACAKNEKKMVKFLLDLGADPNVRGTKDGNTPMHCASKGYICDRIPFGHCDLCNAWGNQSRIEVLKILIQHGATLTPNSNGLNPLCLAAIFNCQDIVEFFLQENTHELQLSSVEKARAYEILGVALGLSTDLKSITYRSEKELCVHFARARSIREESGITSFEDHEQSDVAASFSLFSTKECKTQKDWESIKSDTWSYKKQCFLVAERVLPEELKNRYLMPRLLGYARDGIFHSGMNRERLSQGSQIYREAIQWELQSKLNLGSVLLNVVRGIHTKGIDTKRHCLEDDVVKESYELLDLCLQMFSEVSQECLLDVHTNLVNEVSTVLYDLALYDFFKSKEMFEKLLQIGERMVRVIRKKCNEKCCASVIHCILERINETFWTSSKNREQMEKKRFQQMKENRVKRLISRMVLCEDVTQISSEGYSMLHSLLDDARFAKRRFTKEIALLLIRNGCDIGARNVNGETAREMICKSSHFDPDAPENDELMTLLSPPRTVLPLQEIVARTILRHKIPHEGVVPKHLSVIVTGELEPDSEVFPQYPPSDCESSSTSYYESDYSSLEGDISD